MKKFLLSFLVIASFVFYSLHERKEASEVQLIVPSKITQITPTPDSNASSGSPIPPDTTTGSMMNNAMMGMMYRNGVYTGDVTDAFYGNVQVRATISGGKLTEVEFLQYPDDRATSVRISNQCMPILRQEAIRAQDAQVDIVSGATDTSLAFRESLASALAQAK